MEDQSFNIHHPIAASKQQWRIHLKDIRAHLSFDRQQEASQHAFEELRHLCKNARFVLSFASFGREINLWPLNEELCAQGRLVLPKISEKNELHLFLVDHFNQLVPHHFGMLEPKAEHCQQIDLSVIDIALIPALGFDVELKHRLGYGKGSYDKLLSSAHKTAVWGIGMREMAVANLPFTATDVSLDKIFLF